ncbi:MAG: GNAT family N-acetyltransferase [Alphaproteobacteria bacterium]
MTPAATGERVYLRPFVEADATDRYLAWFRDPDVTRYLEARNITRADAIQHLRDGMNGERWALYAICLRDGDRHVGNLKIGPINRRHGLSDMVTVIGDRDAWGKGIAREAIGLGIRLAFETHGIRKLSASMYAGNLGSIRAYLHAGFVEEARLPAQFLLDGMPEDKVFVGCFNPSPATPGKP